MYLAHTPFSVGPPSTDVARYHIQYKGTQVGTCLPIHPTPLAPTRTAVHCMLEQGTSALPHSRLYLSGQEVQK